MADSPADGEPRPAEAGFGGHALSGLFWIGASNFSNAGASLITLVILARAMTAAEYGLAASLMVVARLLEMLGGLGFRAAIIQRKEECGQHELNVSWTVDRLLIKLVSAVLLLALAGPVSAYFRAPELLWPLRCYALFPIAQGLESNAVMVFTRQLQYRKRVALEFARAFATTALIPLALIWPSVWVVVLAVIGGQLARLATSYVLYPVIPIPTFDWPLSKELFRYGRWLIGIQMLSSFRAQLDKLLLARLLGLSSFAVFEVGNRLGTQMVGLLDNITQKAMFPIYARMQGEHEQTLRRYMGILELLFIAVVPGACVVAGLAQPVVTILVGEKWLAAVPVVRLLAVAGAVRVLVGSGRPLLRGLGKPRLELYLDVGYIVCLVAFMIPLAGRFGLLGAGVAVLAAQLSGLPLLVDGMRRTVGLRAGAVLRLSAYPTLAAGAVGLASWWASGQVAGGGVLGLVVGLAAGLVSYVVLFGLGWRLFDWSSPQLLVAVVLRRFGKRRDGDST